MEIKVKYFNKDITPIERIGKHKSDWIDLRVAEQVVLKAGEYKAVPLGVGMILPNDHEAIIAPRSSTFKRYGVIFANSIGIIDNAYSGDSDEWHALLYATRDIVIPFDERICQFRIQKRMEEIDIVEVENLNRISRGGLGSTNFLNRKQDNIDKLLNAMTLEKGWNGYNADPIPPCAIAAAMKFIDSIPAGRQPFLTPVANKSIGVDWRSVNSYLAFEFFNEENISVYKKRNGVKELDLNNVNLEEALEILADAVEKGEIR